MAQMMPLPLTVSCFSKILTGFTFLVPAHLGSPVPDKGPLNVCVCCIRQVMNKAGVVYYDEVLVDFTLYISITRSASERTTDKSHNWPARPLTFE